MAWKPWIAIHEDNSPVDEARNLYRATRRLDGTVSDLIRITSRKPGIAQRLFELGRSIYESAGGLTLKEKEIAALVTSSFVGCVH